MDTSSNSQSEERPRSGEEILADCLSRMAAGEELDFEQLGAEHPELKSALEQLEHELPTILKALPKVFETLESHGASAELRLLAKGIDGLEAGSVLGEFELIRKLGQGGMGQVWEAHDNKLNRRIALKLMRQDRVSERGLRLFDREARAGGRLNHPGIVTVYAADEVAGVRWIAMELVPGGRTLGAALQQAREQPRLSTSHFDQLAELFLECADAIQVAHDAGVIHRDLKPQNILVDRDGHPKITDFGLAKLNDEQSLSDAPHLVGTYQYMSPEQVAGRGADADERSDIFSLGVVLYEMLTLSRPFDGGSAREVMRRIESVDPRSPHAVSARVPRELSVLCMKCLEKRPEDRFQQIGDLAAELRRYLGDQPIRTSPPSLWRRAQKWMRRHPTSAAVIGVSSAASLGICLLLLQQLEIQGKEEAARKLVAFTEAKRAIEDGDLEAATSHVETALGIDDDDPTGHLILAGGLAMYGRNQEAAERVARAREAGFSMQVPDDGVARDHLWYALSLFPPSLTGEYEQIERHLTRALELDPDDRDLDVAHFTLYSLRKSLGDVAGAKAALALHRRYIPRRRDDLLALSLALAAELDSNWAEAIRILAALRERVGEEAFAELRGHRYLGRFHFDAGNLADSERELREAVSHHPADAASWFNLTLINAQRFDESGRSNLALLDEARLCAEQAEVLRRRIPDYSPLVTAMAVERLHFSLDGGFAISVEDSAEVEELLAEWGEHEPDAGLLPFYAAELRVLRGDSAAMVGEYQEAMEEYLECIELYPAHVTGRIKRAQFLEGAELLGELELALEHFDHASGRGPGEVPSWHRVWSLIAHVRSFGAALALEDPERALDEQRAVELELERADYELPKDELLNYAESLCSELALTLLPGCERALEVIEEFRLRESFRGHPQEQEALRMLREVEQLCGG